MRFRFGLFEFDASRLDLRRDGAAISLQLQPKQALACLLSNAGRTVSRDELRAAIWGADTFVDFDRGLNVCISQLRAALGDDAASPIYLRTVARQGYQFIAPVLALGPDTAGAPSINPARRGRYPTFVVASALLATGIVGLALDHVQHAKTPVVAVVRFDNETDNAFLNRFANDLTDTFVERLTTLSDGQYQVIGNALILRGPRNTRDLTAIATRLRADFVVLGEVQAHEQQTRVLVHLIRMPEQTHVRVARADRLLTNPLQIETDLAQRFAADFARQLQSTARHERPDRGPS